MRKTRGVYNTPKRSARSPGARSHLEGSLELGKLADVAVLDRDYFSIAAQEIRDVQVDMTIVGGKVAYAR